MSGLYKGVTPPLAGVAVVNAIVFGVYGNTLRRLSNPDSLTSQYLAGATAGRQLKNIYSTTDVYILFVSF